MGAMNHCRLKEQCSFYMSKLLRMPPNVGFLKDVYCRRNPSGCMRLKRHGLGIALVGDSGNETTPVGYEYRVPRV